MKFRYQKLPLLGHDPRRPLVARPLLPIILVGKNHRTPTPYYALLDSGADRCIFPAELASHVGIAAIETGARESAVGIGSQRVDVYYHQLSIEIVGDPRDLPTEVGFSREIRLPILGRSFFRHFRVVAFAELKEEVELKP
jgi:hypothetical protein